MMARTHVLLGLAGVGLLVAAAFWSLREPSNPATTSVPTQSHVKPESPALALEADESSLHSSRAAPGGTEDRGPAAAAPRPIVLAGVVLDFQTASQARGNPAASVDVRYIDAKRQGFLRFDSDNDPSSQVVTDEAGRFRIEASDSGERPLTFLLSTRYDSRFVVEPAKVVLAQGEFEATEIVLERYAKGGVAGITVDLQDKRVADVVLTFVSEDRQESVISDSEGQFHIADPEWAQDLKAVRAGYVMTDAPRPVARDDGSFELMRVVMAPAGRLRVAVLNHRGQPVPDASVAVSVSRFETLATKTGHTATRTLSRRLEAKSDAEGIAVVDPVWAGQRLELEVVPSPDWRTRPLTGSRERDGSIRFEDGIEGRPIVVQAGADTLLRGLVPATFRIEGSVQDGAGSPVDLAWVTLKFIEDELDAPAFSAVQELRGAAHFSFEVPATTQSRRARLTAVTGTTLLPTKDTRSCVREFLLEVDKPTETVLVLEKTHAIRGKVIDRDGNGVLTFITPHRLTERSPSVQLGITQTKSNGEFAVLGLLPGRYDLLVRPSERFGDEWVRGVEAGREGLEIRLEKDRTVRIIADVSAGDAEVGQLIFLRGHLSPREHARPSGPPLPPTSEWNEFTGWPVRPGGSLTGRMMTSDPLGDVTYVFLSMSENPQSFLVNEGWSWFGAKGRDRAGRMLYPIGTGLVQVAAGEYRLHFNLVACVPLNGRVRAHEGSDYAVALARSNGELLEFDFGQRRMEKIRELGADGSFAFPGVPIGELELRVGTPHQLLAGEAQHRQPLVVTGTDDPFLEIVVTE